MSDIKLEWDGARADFGLLSGTLPVRAVALVLDGTSSGYATTAASAALAALGPQTFEFRARLALVDWSPNADVSVLDKCDPGGFSEFIFGIGAGGYLMVVLSEDGGEPVGQLNSSTVAVPFANGASGWIRATVDTGAAITFYTSTDGQLWTQLGASVPTPNGMVDISDVDLVIGASRGSVGGPLVGTVFYAAVLDGAGTLVAVFDPATAARGATSFAAVTGESWSIIGASAALTPVEIGSEDGPSYDLVSDEGLETAVVISLFTDRRADEGDVLPGLGDDRRGWWGDALPVVAGDQIGSKLWLLAREKQTPAALGRAEQYAREALAWLVEDQVASRVGVVASAPSAGVLQLDVEIQRPKKRPVQYRFARAWAAQGGE